MRRRRAEGARLRVAYFVGPSQHFAGIERVVHEIASGVALNHADLFEVHVVYATPFDSPELDEVPYTTHVLGVGRLRELGRALRRCVAAEDFDVLICPQVEASVIAWVATRGLRLPVLVPHLHGNPRLEEAQGTLRTRAAFAFFRAVVARRVPMVLAVSPSLRDYAAATIARSSRVVFVKNPVRDLAAGPPVTSPDGVFRFVSIGRLSHQKGHDISLRALARVREDLPPVTLTLVGQGEAGDELRALTRDLGLDDLVTFAGYSADPVEHLRRADCFVLASRWEGFGVVLVEALQCGVPLLAADCEFGPADVISDRVAGTLVPPADPAALGAAMVQASRHVRTTEQDDQRRLLAQGYARDEAVATHFAALMSVVPGGEWSVGRTEKPVRRGPGS